MRRPLNAKAYILRNPSVRTQPTVWSPQWGCKLEALCGWLRLCPGPQWPVGSGFSALETRLPARPWAVEGGVSLVNHKDGNSVRCGLWEEGPSAGSGDGRRGWAEHRAQPLPAVSLSRRRSSRRAQTRAWMQWEEFCILKPPMLYVILFSWVDWCCIVASVCCQAVLWLT